MSGRIYMKYLRYSDTHLEIPKDACWFRMPTIPLGKILIRRDSTYMVKDFRFWLSYPVLEHSKYQWVVIGEDVLESYKQYDASKHDNLPIISAH
jgi:hypothetical protein